MATFAQLIEACESCHLGEPEWHFDGDAHIPVCARWNLGENVAIAVQIEPLGKTAVLWSGGEGHHDIFFEADKLRAALAKIEKPAHPAPALAPDDQCSCAHPFSAHGYDDACRIDGCPCVCFDGGCPF